MLADSRCIEGEVPGYCPPPKLRNTGGADPGTLRYIINNALQISQHGGYLILSIEKVRPLNIRGCAVIPAIVPLHTPTDVWHLPRSC